jgi:hypothetical protein
MLNLCGIVAAIFKMAIGRNFSMSGINSGHHKAKKNMYVSDRPTDHKILPQTLTLFMPKKK